MQETTLGNYRDVIRCYVVPHMGARQLYTLDKRTIHDLYRTLLKRGNKQGGPLSPTTVRIVHRILMEALGDLGVNVDGVRQPRPAEKESMGRKGVWTPAPDPRPTGCGMPTSTVHRSRRRRVGSRRMSSTLVAGPGLGRRRRECCVEAGRDRGHGGM